MQSLGKLLVEAVISRLVFPAIDWELMIHTHILLFILTHTGATHDNDTHLAKIGTAAWTHHLKKVCKTKCVFYKFVRDTKD